jgi:hypothetical protein
MRTFKKIAIVMFTVGSSTVFAGNADQNVTVPNAQNAWSIGAAALYMQPSFGGNGLGYSSFSNYGTDFFGNQLEVNGASNHLSNVHPKHSWGFQLEGSYDYCMGNDVDVNWYHLKHSTRGHLPAGTLFAGSASALYAGELTVAPSWDAVNVEIGQRIDFSDLLMLRLHGGVEFARVKTTFTNYPQLTATGSPVFITTDTIKFTGFGPRVGGDFTYAVGRGLGIYANTAASLLVGSAKQSVAGYQDLGGFNLYSTGNFNQSNNGVVISELEAKLGLKYDCKIGKSNLGFDLGYMWVTYLDALVSQVGSGVVSSSISNSSAANFDLNGLYLGLTWTGK